MERRALYESDLPRWEEQTLRARLTAAGPHWALRQGTAGKFTDLQVTVRVELARSAHQARADVDHHPIGQVGPGIVARQLDACPIADGDAVLPAYGSTDCASASPSA